MCDITDKKTERTTEFYKLESGIHDRGGGFAVLSKKARFPYTAEIYSAYGLIV